MSSGTPSAPPAPPSGTGTGSSGSSGGGSSSSSNPVLAVRIKTVAGSVLYMPSGTQLKILSGPNWSSLSVFTALLQLNEINAILFHAALPSGVDPDDWASVQKKAKAYLWLYCVVDVHSTVESDVEFPTFKENTSSLEIHTAVLVALQSSIFGLSSCRRGWTTVPRSPLSSRNLTKLASSFLMPAWVYLTSSIV